MILPYQKIKEAAPLTDMVERSNVEVPGCPRTTFGLSACTYDLRLENVARAPSMATREHIIWNLEPGESVLGVAFERFQMPDDLRGVVYTKSTLARIFVLQHTTYIDPGFHGDLTLEITNLSDKVMPLYKGMGICQVEFARLEEPTKQPYKGIYQGQRGITGAR